MCDAEPALWHLEIEEAAEQGFNLHSKMVRNVTWHYSSGSELGVTRK